MQQTLKIIIADDHPIFRAGLLRILEDEPDIEIIGETGDGEEALNLITTLKPALAILDISMPGKSGLEIVQESSAQNQETAFIILTMYREEEYFNHALDRGVKGYLLKENASDELLNCIKSVAGGRHYVSPVLSEYLIKRTTQTVETIHELSLLTQMEVRVLQLIAQNKTSKEIADELFISHRTVQNHRTNICNKLELKGHNRLLQFALENKYEFRGVA